MFSCTETKIKIIGSRTEITLRTPELNKNLNFVFKNELKLKAYD